ncbi:TPA: hypothetical protein ACLBHV_000695, partial [Neisseria meningitidis]
QTNNVLFARKPAASRIGLSGLGGMFFKMLQFRTVCGRRIQIFPLDTDFRYGHFKTNTVGRDF